LPVWRKNPLHLIPEFEHFERSLGVIQSLDEAPPASPATPFLDVISMAFVSSSA
jgi:hypothetical protein